MLLVGIPEALRPQRRAGRRVLRDEDIVDPRARERPATEVRRVAEVPGDHNIASAIDRHGRRFVVARAAALLGPQIRARRARILRHEHVFAARARQQAASKIRRASEEVSEIARENDVPIPVDRHRVGHVRAAAPNALRPDVAAIDAGELGHEDVETPRGAAQPTPKIHRGIEVAGDHDVAARIHRHPSRFVVPRPPEALGP